MKDERGLYYFASPSDHKTRVYVRENALGDIEFRLWAEENASIWEQHQWIPYDVLREADELYKKERNAKANPLAVYDLKLARTLIAEEKKTRAL